MQLTDKPAKIILPFADQGSKNQIPVDSQIGIVPGAASLTDGFPPLTMTPTQAGGVPPSGMDMNGILNELSAITRWANAGAGYPYDSTFANSPHVGGYPKGARVLRADGQGYWLNTVDDNTTDPESSGAAAAGWVPDFSAGAASVAMSSANVTLTPEQYGKPIVVITGALTANLNLIFPTIVGEWIVVNGTTGDFTITGKTSAGTGLAIPQGVATAFYGDGTNIHAVNGFMQAGGGVERTLEAKAIEWVSLQDYGGDPTGATPSSAALQKAFDNGKGVVITPGTWQFTPGAVTHNGPVAVIGFGTLSKIQCDGTVFTVTNGTGSIVDNIYMENITAPWVITRDPSNWSAVPAVVQSNNDGYQPTVNDADVWGSLTTAQQNQNVGPAIVFSGNASDIQISRIFGRFVSILMYDCIRSVVRDCDFRAGKNFGGGIIFWNIDNQVGYNNKAINNHIRYASFSGIMFARNFEGLIEGNQIEYVGESGVKTYQGTVGGVDARCYYMTVTDNHVKYSYFDGFDLNSDYPHLGTADSHHIIEGNSSFGNHKTGFFADGINNTYVGNRARNNGLTGHFLDYSNSLIEANHAQDNNAQNQASGHHDIIVGGNNNSIVGNYVRHAAGRNGHAIYAPGTNFVAVNKATDSQFFFGSYGSVTSTLVNNEDNQSIPLRVTMGQQVRQEATGMPAMTLYGDSTGFDNIDQVFHPRKHLLANPIAKLSGVLRYGVSGSENGWLIGYGAQGGALVPGFTVQTDNAIPGKAWLTVNAPNAGISGSWIANGTWASWIDETNNLMKFVVKYSNGTIKSGSIALT